MHYKCDGHDYKAHDGKMDQQTSQRSDYTRYYMHIDKHACMPTHFHTGLYSLFDAISADDSKIAFLSLSEAERSVYKHIRDDYMRHYKYKGDK